MLPEMMNHPQESETMSTNSGSNKRGSSLLAGFFQSSFRLISFRLDFENEKLASREADRLYVESVSSLESSAASVTDSAKPQNEEPQDEGEPSQAPQEEQPPPNDPAPPRLSVEDDNIMPVMPVLRNWSSEPFPTVGYEERKQQLNLTTLTIEEEEPNVGGIFVKRRRSFSADQDLRSNGRKSSWRSLWRLDQELEQQPLPATSSNHSRASVFSDVEEEEEMRRKVRQSVRACRAEIKKHAESFLAQHPNGSYEDWIAELHPENVYSVSSFTDSSESSSTMTAAAAPSPKQQKRRIDHRFYIQESDHRRVWNKRVSRDRRVKPRSRELLQQQEDQADADAVAAGGLQPAAVVTVVCRTE